MQNDESQSNHLIHNLVYCSQAAQGVDKDALEKIIAAAKRHNPSYGITGLLVFGSGIFFQWLEGPKDNVTSLLQMISADPRHSNVVILTQEDENRERLFPNWDMELVEAADIKVVLEDALVAASNPKQKKKPCPICCKHSIKVLLVSGMCGKSSSLVHRNEAAVATC